MIGNKHIALWTCPRSRSTLMARAFEQLDGCLIFDEPLYSPYLLKSGFDHPHRKEIMEVYETDYVKVISKITGDLPLGYSFSFQKHIAKHVLPEFGTEWLKHFYHIFLIRDPREVILSWYKVFENVTTHDIGITNQYEIFKEVERLLDRIPLIIDSLDLVKNPRKVLSFMCSHFNLDFSEDMLVWEPGLKNSQLLFAGALSSLAPTWYSVVADSAGFLPYQEKETVKLPDSLKPVVEECLPFYQKLYKNRHIFN